MDHSHTADKSIKHYADAKRVPMRKVAHHAAVFLCLFVFFIFLTFTRRRSVRQGDGTG